ncbi:hypothetical protein [Roseomonas marmotae]|uniref:Enolase C-terminal domain-containing protein n=1 Tax=Roseomonas marmotae TaxID=2768161 RepID=A0ABS3KD64_9PROT|nr:hypothetical protein [Roseomonas marmotae]MBO1075406.1 hypothetical protein [Roseomonas marmotae]QTI78395.1 hypothetical protein IAI58_11910 [Roseomonas marmotae]
MPGYLEFTDDPQERRIRRGRVDISDRPGLGINLLPEVIAPYRWATVS